MLRAPGAQGHPEAFRLAVVHLPTRLAQLGHEVAQGAPEQHQPLAMQGHELQATGALNQQQAALALGLSRAQPVQQIPQGRLGERELILEDQDADAHRSRTSRVPSGGRSSSNLAHTCGPGQGDGLVRLRISTPVRAATGLFLPAGPALADRLLSFRSSSSARTCRDDRPGAIRIARHYTRDASYSKQVPLSAYLTTIVLILRKALRKAIIPIFTAFPSNMWL